MGDIYSHTPEPSAYERQFNGLYYDDPREGPTTAGHETTHMMDARWRNHFKKPNGFYVLKGKLFLCGNPNVRMRQVAEAVPVNLRGSIYDLYLVKSQQWYDDTPFYVIEELNGYVNGCLVGLDYGLKRETLYSYTKVLEMWEYTKVAQELSRKANFPEQKELDNFLDWYYTNRVAWIAGQMNEKGW